MVRRNALLRRQVTEHRTLLGIGSSHRLKHRDALLFQQVTRPETFVAVGTPVDPTPPRTDPYVQDFCIRLLPRIPGVKAHVRMRMQDLRTWNPSIDQLPEPLPTHPVSLTPPPKRAVRAVQTIHIAGYCM